MTEMLERKVLRAQKIAIYGLAFVFASCAAFMVFVAYEVTHQKSTQDQVIACFIQASFDRSELALPNNSFYRNHPDDLADALIQIKEQRGDAITAFGKCKTPSAVSTTS